MSEVRHATDPVSGKRVEIRDDLVKRLRGLYAIGPTLPNGEPEFGWRQIGLPAAIQLEAATEIEQIEKERAGFRVALETIAIQHPHGPETSKWMQGVARDALQPLT